VQRRGLRHLPQVGPQPALVLRDRPQLAPLLGWPKGTPGARA
jgi:hypothetical protein